MKHGAGGGEQQWRRLEQELERACLRQLRREWEICNWLYCAELLRPPTFRLDRGGCRWGQWEPEGRVIAISETLVLDHPWLAVQEVLRHEMAHQIVHELFGLHDAPAHGEAFRRACRMLGIPAYACGDPLRVFEGPRQAEGADREKQAAVLRKVRRLLALADSPNAHEAEAALAKANELLLRYNLQLAESADDSERYCVRQVGQITARRSRAARLAASIISRHFFCEAVWVTAYCPRTGRQGRVLELTGNPDNVELAAYTYEEMLRTAERLWRKHKQEKGLPGDRWRRRFIEGVLYGFDEKLTSERERMAHEHALVWRGDPNLEAFFARRHPRLASDRIGLEGGVVFEQGRAVGRDLQIRPAMPSGPARDRGLQLPGG